MLINFKKKKKAEPAVSGLREDILQSTKNISMRHTATHHSLT